MICKNCNTLNSNDASVCINCGEKLLKQEKIVIKKKPVNVKSNPIPARNTVPVPDINKKFKQSTRKFSFNPDKTDKIILHERIMKLKII